MADDQDDSQKTEDPTSKKLADARKQGQVASSQEVKHWFVLLGVLAVISIYAPIFVPDLLKELQSYLHHVEGVPVDFANLSLALRQTLIKLLLLLLLPLLTLIVFAFLGNYVQVGFLVSAEQLKPKLSKINPISGAKKLFSMRSVIELLKGIAKMGLIGTMMVFIAWPTIREIESQVGGTIEDFVALIWVLSVKILIGTVAIVGVMALADYLYQKYDFMKNQRMTKQEVKDEFKNTEGDPLIKSKLRQIRAERARRRMMSAVPTADAVITNPTHYAVAIKYEQSSMTAPKVVAKGVDHLAMRIRALAEEHNVAVIESPPLARALYATVEIDQEIPYEHYKAVAEIISYVYRSQNRNLASAASRKSR